MAALRRGEPVPEDGYKGDYVEDACRGDPRRRLGRRDVSRAPTRRASSDTGRPGGSARASRRVSTALGVRFDVWTSEARLHEEGWVERAVERLRERGHVYEQDGAIWFRSTAFGDDKDRVIIRSNGEPTYFAADIGYVTEKFSRGFDHLIYIWGADHHGTVARVRNAAAAMGYDQDAVEMKLYSWVRFVRDGQEVSMSKRAGEFITLDELLAEVGVDAARWFFASRVADHGHRLRHRAMRGQRRPSSRRHEEAGKNPVYYVQYAHARIASILRKAADVGIAPADGRDGALAGAPEARPGAGDRALPRGGRGRRRRRGDPGDHGLRDGARDDLPRLLPRCPGRRCDRARALRGSPGPRECGTRSRSRMRSACWGSPPPSRCSAGPWRPAGTSSRPGRGRRRRSGAWPRRSRRPPSGSCRLHPGGPARARRPSRARSWPRSRTRRHRPSCPTTVCIATAHAPPGP